jgi:hypothetical protein
MSMKTLAVLGDTWQTDQLDLLEFAIKNPIPRQGSRILQLRRDIRSPLMWLILTYAVAGIILGVMARQPMMGIYATLMLLIVGFMFSSVAKGHSRSPLIRGVIENAGDLRHHPMGLGHVAKASLVSQETDVVASVGLTNAGAVDLLKQNGRLEVLVLYDPKAEYSSVIGWRVAA